jgi:hypothetical protein
LSTDSEPIVLGPKARWIRSLAKSSS